MSKIDNLQDAWDHSTKGVWQKGRTTHHTVTIGDGHTKPYDIAEFRHADDATFCDVAHELAPAIVELHRAAREAVSCGEKGDLAAAMRSLDAALGELE